MSIFTVSQNPIEESATIMLALLQTKRVAFYAGPTQSNFTEICLNLATNTIVESLTIGGISYATNIPKLAKALESNVTLTRLCLFGANINSTGAAAIAKSLEKNKTLIDVTLQSTKLGNEGAVLIANALQTNKTLKYLVLASNDIGYVGSLAITQALETNKTLEILNLECNPLGLGGAMALVNMLQTNRTLVQVRLTWNDLGDAGTAAFIAATQPICTTKRPDQAWTYVNPMVKSDTLTFQKLLNENYAQTAAVLVERGCITAGDCCADGWTLLMGAARRGHVHMAAIALQIFDTPRADKHVAMLCAAAHCHIDCFEFIARRLP